MNTTSDLFGGADALPADPRQEFAPEESDAVTIVLAPVELSVVTTTRKELLHELQEIARKFQMNPAELVAQGFVKVFAGDAVSVGVRDADIHLAP